MIFMLLVILLVFQIFHSFAIVFQFFGKTNQRIYHQIAEGDWFRFIFHSNITITNTLNTSAGYSSVTEVFNSKTDRVFLRTNFASMFLNKVQNKISSFLTDTVEACLQVSKFSAFLLFFKVNILTFHFVILFSFLLLRKTNFLILWGVILLTIMGHSPLSDKMFFLIYSKNFLNYHYRQQPNHSLYEKRFYHSIV